jgi:hypothetical protein
LLAIPKSFRIKKLPLAAPPDFSAFGNFFPFFVLMACITAQLENFPGRPMTGVFVTSDFIPAYIPHVGSGCRRPLSVCRDSWQAEENKELGSRLERFFPGGASYTSP